MNRICFGIYDREAGYARRLGAYLRRRCSDILEIKVFTKREALASCLEAGGIQLVLTGQDAEELCRKYEKVWCAVFSEEGENGGQSDNLRIAKYQSAELIWRWILKLAGDRLSGGGLLTDSETETEFLAVCSPVHGCGKTTMGLIMSRLLSGGNKGPALFLTMDEFSSLSVLTGEEGDAEFSELFYYYSQGELTKPRLQAAVGRWGEAEYILPARVPEDLYPEGKPYDVEFLKYLVRLGGYRQAVLDVGNSIWGKAEILRLCRRIYIPGGETACDEMRIESFMAWMEGQRLENKSIRLCMPEGPGNKRNRYSDVNRAFCGPFGQFIKETLERSGYDPGEGK